MRDPESPDEGQLDAGAERTLPTAASADEAQPIERTMPTQASGSPGAEPERTMPTAPSGAGTPPSEEFGTARTITGAEAPAEGADRLGLTPLAPEPAEGRRGFQEKELILNRYRIVGELGRGGMGVVYRCHDEIGDVSVAVKTIPPMLSHNKVEMEEIRDNFRLIERLHHPHIADAKTLEKDPETGEYYLIMEYADGINLRQYRKKHGGSIGLEEAVPIVRQVASALDYGHSEQIIHRDVKPANIMINDNGKVKILDYGIASQYHESMSRVSQGHFETSGTGPYMAPEQWKGEYQDKNTDQYALAALCYELLAGRPPFLNPDLGALRETILKDKPAPIEGLPPRVWKALGKGLNKGRKDRYHSCSEFISAMEDAMANKKTSLTAGRSLRPAIYGLAALVLLMGAAAGAMSLKRGAKAKNEMASAYAAVTAMDWGKARNHCEAALSQKPGLADAGALLTKINDRGKISLTSTPLGAEVWINNKKVGSTPFMVEQLPNEAVTLMVKAEGYQPFQQQVTLSAQDSIQRDVVLKGLAVLKVVSDPPGARIWVDGKPVAGTTPVNLEDLGQGEVEVRAELDGHRSVTRTVMVRPQGETLVNLGKLVANHGSVTIQTTPEGATVRLGSEEKPSPATFASVAVGTHEVWVQKFGFKPRSMSIQVADAAAVNKSLILEKLAVAAVTPTPPVTPPVAPPVTPTVTPPVTPTAGTGTPAVPVTPPVTPPVNPPVTPIPTPTPTPIPTPVTPVVAPVVAPPVPTPATPRVARKARIAVVPAVFEQGARSKFMRELFEKFNISDPAAVESPGFTGHLVDRLVNTRKFDVLEREALRDVVKELDLGESDYGDPAKVAKIGQMLNADYVVVPVIRYILLSAETREVPFVGQTRTTFTGTFGSNVRVIDVRTSRISSSKMGETEYAQRQERTPAHRAKQGMLFLDRLLAQTALEASSDIIDVIYPIKIVAVDGKNVTVNRGKGAIKPGEVLSVYSQGEAMVDPDTGEMLGFSESVMGKVRITQVMAKVAIAEVVEGSVKKLMVCRRDREIEKLPPTAAPRID